MSREISFDSCTRIQSPYYGWVMVGVGAVLMAATLPGRTHGVGLITKRLLEDLQISNLSFAHMNFWATLLGAAFCLPCGWMLDRFGLRRVTFVVLASLAASVIAVSRVESTISLAVTMLLTRGLGQSMLSVVSITVVAKWFGRRIGPAMGVYSVMMSFLMAAATGLLGVSVASNGWRHAWSAQGWILLSLVVPIVFLTRNSPKNANVEFASIDSASAMSPSATLSMALRTPCFWVFALSISFFGLISSGLTLFNQFVLEERGFDETVFHKTLVIGLLAGMVANLATGAVAIHFPLERVLAVGLLLLAAALVGFPLVRTTTQVYGYAIFMGVAGGILTVLFFSIWGHAFGPKHLGKIQAAAQMVTVLASALGPVLVSLSESYTGSYSQVFSFSSSVAFVMALVALRTPVPNAMENDWAFSNLPETKPEGHSCPAA